MSDDNWDAVDAVMAAVGEMCGRAQFDAANGGKLAIRIEDIAAVRAAVERAMADARIVGLNEMYDLVFSENFAAKSQHDIAMIATKYMQGAERQRGGAG